MRRWSRSTAICAGTARGAIARFGSQFQTIDQHDHRERPRPRRRRRCRSRPCWPAAASAGARSSSSHFAAELAEVAKAIGPDRPVKLVWTREDDHARRLLSAALRASPARRGAATARSSAWTNTHRRPVVHEGHALRGDDGQGRHRRDHRSRARTRSPTRSPNFRCDLHITEVGVPTLWWRRSATRIPAMPSNASSTSCWRRPGRIRSQGRLALMGEAAARGRRAAGGRGAGGLERARAGDGRARGVAVVESFDTFVAQIAEVSRRRATASRRCTRSGARSIAASRSIPTSSARRWKAASASASATRSSPRSTLDRGPAGAAQFRHLSLAAHQRDAGGRGRDRAVDREADRRRRARRAADRAGGRQCAGARSGTAGRGNCRSCREARCDADRARSVAVAASLPARSRSLRLDRPAAAAADAATLRPVSSFAVDRRPSARSVALFEEAGKVLSIRAA